MVLVKQNITAGLLQKLTSFRWLGPGFGLKKRVGITQPSAHTGLPFSGFVHIPALNQAGYPPKTGLQNRPFLSLEYIQHLKLHISHSEGASLSQFGMKPYAHWPPAGEQVSAYGLCGDPPVQFWFRGAHEKRHQSLPAWVPPQIKPGRIIPLGSILPFVHLGSPCW